MPLGSLVPGRGDQALITVKKEQRVISNGGKIKDRKKKESGPDPQCQKGGWTRFRSRGREKRGVL